MTTETSLRASVDKAPVHVASGVSVSRRGLMNFVAKSAALATATAIGGPALVPSLAEAASGADAELLQLGAELEVIVTEWHAQRAIDKAGTGTWEEACIRAGLPRIEFGSIPNEEWRAYQDKRGAINDRHARANADGADEAWGDIQDRMWPMIDDILECRAQTVAGFTVQVRAVSLLHAELWDGGPSDGDDYRPFIDAACTFAGVVPVPLSAEAASPVRQASAPPAEAAADPIIDLAQRTIDAHHHYEATCCALNPCEQAFLKWREANAVPADAGTSAMKEWKQREKAAKRRTGLSQAGAVQRAASTASVKLIDELIQAQPRTLAGLVAKARAARVVKVNEIDDGLAVRIVWDIGVLAGETAPEEAAAL